MPPKRPRERRPPRLEGSFDAGPPGPTDDELVARVAQHDHDAFDLLVERYRERAHRLAWQVTRDQEAAKDLSQEAFVRVYRSAGSFEGHARFSTWFFRILMNLCLDHKRGVSRWRRLFLARDTNDESRAEQELVTPDLLEEMSQERQMAQLWAAVEHLALQQRTVLLLQVQEGMGTREIAEVLSLEESTVRVHLHRALTHLRSTLGKC